MHSEIDLEAMKKSENPRILGITKKLKVCRPGLIEGVEFIPIPGHTIGTTGILFDTVDGRTCVCGDAVMTRDFFINRQGYYNSVDFAKSSESIEKMAGLADIVVPGHGNYFLNKR